MKNFFINMIMLVGMAFTTMANATYIASSNDCPGDAGCDSSVTAQYGFDIKIETTDNRKWTLTLDNTSISSRPVIDMFALNMNAILGVDFTVANFNPAAWSFDTLTTGGIQFDYVGNSNSSSARLGSGESLSFDFLFGTASDYTVWTNTFANLGTGLGGDNDLGQFLVGFEELGSYCYPRSDVIGDSWQYVHIDPKQVPEPNMLMLMSVGIIGIGFVRNRINKNEQDMVNMRV